MKLPSELILPRAARAKASSLPDPDGWTWRGGGISVMEGVREEETVQGQAKHFALGSILQRNRRQKPKTVKRP